MEPAHDPGEALLVGACFGGLGAVMFMAFVWRRAARRRARDWTVVSGLVVGSSDDSAPSITVRYQDAVGNAHLVSSLGGSTGFPGVGERTPVRYDPDQPDDALLDVDVKMGEGLALLMAAMFTAIGLVLGAAGLFG